MREAVSGRYGGGGLVIAGSKGGKPEDGGSSVLQQQAAPVEEKEKGMDTKNEKTGPVGSTTEEGKEGGEKGKGAAAGGGGFRDGITVVSAFEGCVCFTLHIVCVYVGGVARTAAACTAPCLISHPPILHLVYTHPTPSIHLSIYTHTFPPYQSINQSIHPIRYAYDAGMRVGDRLLAVDGVPLKGRTVDQVCGI